METEASDFYADEVIRLQNEKCLRTTKNILQDGKFVFSNVPSDISCTISKDLYYDKKLLNFSSNDYLGISADYNIKDNFLSSYKGKISNPSARLLSGTNKVFDELENLLAFAFDKEKALIFNSGYHANVGIYSSLVGKDDAVFVDRLNHASIIDGVHLSKASLIPYKHLDYNDLRQKLIEYRKKYKKVIISSESMFSMDGDFANIKKLVQLKNEFNALLIIDEAHSFGVYGDGIGLCKEQEVLSSVDLIMATFGKAVGSYGAFAVGNKSIINYLVNFARPFIFSTSLPEISVSFSKYVLENYIFNSNTLREKLFLLCDLMHKNTKNYTNLENIKNRQDNQNLQISPGSYIIPVITGSNESALELSEKLINSGFYILPIRYPTVKKNTARVRISLMSAFSEEDINSLCLALGL